MASFGTVDFAGNTIVSGPGKNASANFLASLDTSSDNNSNSSIDEICAMSGLSAGLPFASNTFRNASGLNAEAPRP